MAPSKNYTQARATRTKAAKSSSTTRITRSMVALRSGQVQVAQNEAAEVGSPARITRSMTALRNNPVRATRGKPAKVRSSARFDRSRTTPRSERTRAAWRKGAKVGSFTRFTRSMTAPKDDQAQATRTTEAEVSSPTRVTRSMTPPRSDPFPILALPLELFENVLEFCDADSMSSLRLTNSLLERQTYHEWSRRRQTAEFNSHQDKPEVYAKILEACPQLGANVTRLILAPPDGHESDSHWRRIPLLAILPRIIRHVPKLQHLEIRYWAMQYNLPSLAELAQIFEKIKINTLTLDHCVLYGSDLKALLGTSLVAPNHTLLKESSIMGTLVTTLSTQGTSIPEVRTEHSFSVGVQGVNFPSVVRAVFPFREFEGLKYEILAYKGKRSFEVEGYAPIDAKKEQKVEEVRIVKVV